MSLRTLILLRWIAVTGQAFAFFVAIAWLDMAPPLGACMIVMGCSVIVNLVLLRLLPRSYRLRSTQAGAMMLFDLVQLAALIALNGGLNNPFAVLLIVPVSVAATGLTTRSTAVLGAATAILVPLISIFHLPLTNMAGQELRMPPLLNFGFGLAILTGAAFLALYARRISSEVHNMTSALMATEAALAREQKLTDLGGVVAAAAHELGTPLATITLVSAELIDDLEGRDDLKMQREDAMLIREQADRCRDILRSMGRAGKDDLHMRQVPLEAILREAAEPHANRNRSLVFDLHPVQGVDPRQPDCLRAPTIIHGLRNLVQNAVDFSESTVWIDGQWTDQSVTVRVIDDGPGYPPHLLDRIGDPFLRSGRDDQRERPGYEGMGLGLFIAKTLLERSGATLTFDNGREPGEPPGGPGVRRGAIVEVTWPREAIAPPMSGGLGLNQPIEWRTED